MVNDSFCEMSRFHFVWGRNFDADEGFVSALAGVYGLVQPNLHDETMVTFLEHGALAAVFALATVEERPSILPLVRPKVNLVYII